MLDHLGALVDKIPAGRRGRRASASSTVGKCVAPRSLSDLISREIKSDRLLALEKPREAGETDATLQRHAQAVLALFESAYAQEWVVPSAVRRERHLPDLDNLRAALDWAAQSEGEAKLHIEAFESH